MINLLVVSDTHGVYKKLEAVLERQLALDGKFRPSHLVHLGDGIYDIDRCKLSEKFCIHTVKGNCDSFFYSSSVPTERLISLGEFKILALHGHTRSVKSGDSVAVAYAVESGADLLLYGHTHVPVCYSLREGTELLGTILKKPLTVFNPGSLGYDGSFGVVSLCENGVVCSHVSIK